jgi:site-specific recombinase XerD
MSKAPKEPQGLTIAELVRLADVVKKHSYRDFAMIITGVYHGLRVSELTGLRVSDVDLTNNQITVRRLKGSLTQVQDLRASTENFESESSILRHWLKIRVEKSDYVFPSERNRRMDRSTFFRLFQSYAEQAKIPVAKHHPHVLKHSLGFILNEAGASLSIIQAALGHKNISSTIIYARATSEQANRAVKDALGKLL